MRQFLIYTGRRLWSTIVLIVLGVIIFTPAYVSSFCNSFADWYFSIMSFTSEEIAVGIFAFALIVICIFLYVALNDETPKKIRNIIFIIVGGIILSYLTVATITGFTGYVLSKIYRVFAEDFKVNPFIVIGLIVASLVFDKYMKYGEKERWSNE